MNAGDVFVVSTGKLVFIRTERQGKTKVYVFKYDADDPKYSKIVKQNEDACMFLKNKLFTQY